VLPQTHEDAAQPLQIPGIAYQEINLNGSSYSRSLISKLSWWNTIRLLGLMATGYRVEAISILGKNVMQARGLNGLALDTLDVCGNEIRQVFEVLADGDAAPFLVHCTQGKDRTGITVLLVLMLLGVEEAAIERDYLRSEPELLPEREGKLEDIHSIGLGDEFADCPPDFVSTVCGHINEKYGSIEEYFNSIGVGPDMQTKIRHNFGISS
jgi:protein-tyrosine phosphatase